MALAQTQWKHVRNNADAKTGVIEEIMSRDSTILSQFSADF